jgi:hypothetical protein
MMVIDIDGTLQRAGLFDVERGSMSAPQPERVEQRLEHRILYRRVRRIR